MLAGAALGLIGAGVVAWSWTRWGRRLNMGAILKVTALFLGLFLVQLLVYGIHELAESGVIQGSQAFHDATELFGPDGPHRPRALVLAAAGAAAVPAVGAPRAAADRGASGSRYVAAAACTGRATGRGSRAARRRPRPRRCRPRWSAPPRRRRGSRPQAARLVHEPAADAAGGGACAQTTTRLDVEPAPRHHRGIVGRVVDARHQHRRPRRRRAPASATKTGGVVLLQEAHATRSSLRGADRK